MPSTTTNDALRRVASLKGGVKTLTERLGTNVSFQSSQAPAYSFEETLKELADDLGEMTAIQAAIQEANASTTLDWKGQRVSVTWSIKRLQELRSLIATLRGLDCRPRANFETDERVWDYESDEHVYKKTMWTCSFPERQRDEMTASLQSEFNKLNSLLESVNHTNTVTWP